GHDQVRPVAPVELDASVESLDGGAVSRASLVLQVLEAVLDHVRLSQCLGICQGANVGQLPTTDFVIGGTKRTGGSRDLGPHVNREPAVGCVACLVDSGQQRSADALAGRAQAS